MSKEEIIGIVRHTLTFAGGILVMKGFIEAGFMQELIGSAITLTGLVLSVLNKRAV